MQQKSLLIIEAQFQKAIGRHDEAVRLFDEAARLEEKIAGQFRQGGNEQDAAISLFSAASCYRQAGDLVKAQTSAEEALKLTGSSDFSKEIQRFITECTASPTSSSPRTLRGIVRNGAVYPLEPDVLAEGELVTITAA